MKSMTGFGQGKAQAASTQIEVSVRAVNGRFLETRFHLPREYVGMESDLKKQISKYFQRGTLDIFVSRRVRGAASPANLVVNKELAKKYHSAYKALAKELKLSPQLHVEIIARLPDVIKTEDSGEVTDKEKKTLVQVMEKACKACDAEREREGRFLCKDLDGVIGELEKEVNEILSLREEVNKTLLARFEQKIKTRLAGVEVDSARISQEVVIQLEKSDINEEVTRLREHIKNYGDLLHRGQAQGKKLDFYTQELLREVNTIGSKSSVSKLTQSVVQAKTLIERLREQVQNVE
ncbi:MAG: YicC family protein [Bdellovibrio sp. CG10_big_fil_rev_8_21_14_0_10_47_8]|nr:MAG: YicC family protein [Bdellovibrio sp. CG10_big_fil_rev_8_21_14_0_10_47_8]